MSAQSMALMKVLAKKSSGTYDALMNQIKRIRTTLGVSQSLLGAGLGVSQANVSFYERGQSMPQEVARKLIDFAAGQGLRITFDHIYGVKDIPAKAKRRKATAGEV
jgi:putative transcriptional regulator